MADTLRPLRLQNPDDRNLTLGPEVAAIMAELHQTRRCEEAACQEALPRTLFSAPAIEWQHFAIIAARWGASVARPSQF
jgi:hypothetical protein